MHMQTVFMRATEVGEHLGITPERVYQLVNEGLLPGFKRGKRTLIPRRAFEIYIEWANREALGNLASASAESGGDA